MVQDTPRHRILSTKVFVTPVGQVGRASANAAVAANKKRAREDAFVGIGL